MQLQALDIQSQFNSLNFYSLTEVINTGLVVVDSERQGGTLPVNDDSVPAPQMVEDGGDAVDRGRGHRHCQQSGD